MSTVILVVHLLIAVALVATVLLQRSEGGALGIGGGGGGGFMTGRGTANLLTRITAFLAAAFFCTSIVLTILARQSADPTSILEGVQPPQTESGTDAPDTAPLAPGLPEGPQIPQSR